MLSIQTFDEFDYVKINLCSSKDNIKREKVS